MREHVNEHPLRVTVWGENVHERREDPVRAIYPDGMHAVIAAGLTRLLGRPVHRATVTLQDPEHGLHRGGARRHGRPDVVGPRRPPRRWTTRWSTASSRRSWAAWACSCLHSGHEAKVFQRLLGTSCSLRWRNSGERELDRGRSIPAHPDRRGRPAAHRASTPTRCTASTSTSRPPTSSCSSRRSRAGRCSAAAAASTAGRGRIFYFSPGDQEYPIYHHPDVRRVIANGVRWARPPPGRQGHAAPSREAPTSAHADAGAGA
jgi:trehalose utilization protein